MADDLYFKIIAHDIGYGGYVHYGGKADMERAQIKECIYVIGYGAGIVTDDGYIHILSDHILVALIIYVKVQVVGPGFIQPVGHLMGVGIIFGAHQCFCTRRKSLQGFYQVFSECKVQHYYLGVLSYEPAYIGKGVGVCGKYYVNIFYIGLHMAGIRYF